MISDIIFEAIGKFFEDVFNIKSKIIWMIIGLILILVLLILIIR